MFISTDCCSEDKGALFTAIGTVTLAMEGFLLTLSTEHEHMIESRLWQRLQQKRAFPLAMPRNAPPGAPPLTNTCLSILALRR